MSWGRLDLIYRKLLLSKFFTKGWGKPDNLKRIFAFRKLISDREKCQHLVSSDYPITIDKEYIDGDCRILEGHFLSPFVHHLPGIMPKEVETASFQMLLPVKWKHPAYRPVCVHLAGTGDHFFWRRRLLTARPLLKEAGIASILLENPYYGTRKPKDQLRSSLHNVSDLFVMGGALVLESLALFHWCERQGFGPLGISGISMGGHMASLAATNWTRPIPLVPILSWSTASAVFTEGVMSGAIPWRTLQEQFFNNNVYQEEIRHLLVSPEDHHQAYEMGQEFAKKYTQNMDKFETDLQTVQSQRTAPTSTHIMRSEGSEGPPPKPLVHSVVDTSPSIDRMLNANCDMPVGERAHNQAATAPVLVSSGVTLASLNKSSSSKSEAASNTQSTSVKQYWQHQQPLTVSYAQTKGQTGGPSHHKSPPNPLTVKHAAAKSRLLSRRSSKLPEDEATQRTLESDALDFMRGVMDECTHLGNFSVPVDPELVIIVLAKQDAYIPRDRVLGLDKLWPGCELRYVDQGHVGAVLFNQARFRKAIIDAFEKQVKKYGLPSTLESSTHVS